MKLIVEIGENLNDGKYVYGIRSLLATDEREGDEIYDKECQSGEVARLIDLSELIEKVVKNYNGNRTTPSYQVSYQVDEYGDIICQDSDTPSKDLSSSNKSFVRIG